MATVKTIKPAGGGDYTTLASWWAWAKQQATADQWAEVYSGGDVGGLSFTAFDSATVSSSAYPRIYGASGERHEGKIPTSVNDVAYVNGEIYIYDGYTEIDGLYIKNSGDYNISVRASQKEWVISNCILHNTDTTVRQMVNWSNWAGSSTLGYYIYNNIIRCDATTGASTTPLLYLGGNNQHYANFYNNTISCDEDCIGVEFRGIGTASWSSVCGDVYNNASFVGSGGTAFGLRTAGGFLGDADNNACNDTSATDNLGGTSNQESKTASNQFTDVTDDWTILTGADLKYNGTTTLTGTDAIGTTWNSPASIGALEFISSGSTGQIKAYTGASFESKPVKWYNGSDFVTKPLKVYNGSSWGETGY